MLSSMLDLLQEEIKKILSIGVDASRIIFANPAKPASHLKYAVDQRIELLTVDGENELYKIKKFHPAAKYVSICLFVIPILISLCQNNW